MKKIFAICVLLLAGHVFAADLKLLSFNTFMLPKPFKNSLQEVRTKIIPQQLKGKNYDVMFFQEVFTTSFQNDLKSALKSTYPYSYFLKNRFINFPLVSSGVFIMSRKPIKVIDKVYFTKCAKEDCLVSKGAVLIEVKASSGKIVQFAATHLQAGESRGEVRMLQLAQINRMLSKHKRAGIPQILVGDLNIDAPEREFGLGLELLGMEATDLVGPIRHTNARVNDCFEANAKEKEWVDHFWVSRDGGVARSHMQVKVLEFGFNGKVCPSSDHHAVEAQFDF